MSRQSNSSQGFGNRGWVGAAVVIAAGLLTAGVVPAEDTAARVVIEGPEVRGPVEPLVFEGSLLDLPTVDGWWPEENAPAGSTRDYSTPVASFPGLGYRDSEFLPPDTVGDVGRKFYIQAVNAANGAKFMVFTKDGTDVAGPTLMESLATGGECRNGSGNPMVLYDRLAGRWLMAEVSEAGKAMCIYISRSDDPVGGGWHMYEFRQGEVPYFAHYGVWWDAYYATTYEGSDPPIYAFERSRMLAGGEAQELRFDGLGGIREYGRQALTPADLDGATPPPDGAPGIIMRHYDDEADGGSDEDDKLQMWEVAIDWDTPGNSRVNEVEPFTIRDFNSWLVDWRTQDSIPQPDEIQRLDSAREFIMHRLAYRNLGKYESLVGNFVTNLHPKPDGGDVTAGIRWFELRRAKGRAEPWVLAQDGQLGDLAEPTLNRWLGAIAQDAGGNIALGYNVTRTSNPLTCPTLARTGHSAGASDGVMDMPERAVAYGTASQGTSDGNWWGRYAAMSVDPADECTFWLTGTYNDPAKAGWQTWIQGFNFENPTSVDVTPDGTVDHPYLACVGASVLLTANTVGGSNLSYEWTEDGSTIGTDDPQVLVTNNSGTYHYNCEVSGGCCTAGVEDPEDTYVRWQDEPLFEGAKWVSAMAALGCGLRVEWDAASACQAKASVVYNVYRSTNPSFTPNSSNRVAECVGALFYDDTDVSPSTNYYYIVRAEDSWVGNGGPCNDGNEDGNLQRASAVWSEGLGTFANMADAENAGWMHGADQGVDDWTVVPHLAFKADTTTSQITDKYLISPELRIGPTARLQFFHSFRLDWAVDGGVLEISTDGGQSWTYITSTPYFLLNGYDVTIGDGSNPLNGKKAWSGQTETGETVVVDLTDWAGTTARLRWRMGLNNTPNPSGEDWTLDNFLLNNTASASCHPLEDPLRFETGRASDQEVMLEWLNPDPPSSGVEYQFTQICWSTVDFPNDPWDCGLDFVLCGGSHLCTTPLAGPGDYDAWVHQPLVNDTTYYYSGWVHYVDTQSEEFFYSAAKTVRAYPFNTSNWVRWAFHGGDASSLVPPGLGSLFAISNTQGIFSLGWGPGGGSWLTGSTPLVMTAPAQARPPVINFNNYPMGSHTKVVFVGLQDGTVLAMDGNDGSEIWTSAIFGTFTAAPAGVFREFGAGFDRLLIGTRNAGQANEIVAIDPYNLSSPNPAVWTFDNGALPACSGTNCIGIISGTLSVTYEPQHKAYFASREYDALNCGTLWCIDFDDGQGTDCGGGFPLELGDIDGSPILRGGFLYVGTNAGLVYKVNAATGARAWTSPFNTSDGMVKGYVSPDPASSALYLSTSTTVWCLSDDGESASLDWSVNTIPNPSLPLFAPNSDYLYVGGSDGRIYQIDVTGPTVTSQDLGLAFASSSAVGSPALDVVNEMIYVGTEVGALYSVDVPF